MFFIIKPLQIDSLSEKEKSFSSIYSFYLNFELSIVSSSFITLFDLSISLSFHIEIIINKQSLLTIKEYITIPYIYLINFIAIQDIIILYS